jgi:serine/threonine protein kinase
MIGSAVAGLGSVQKLLVLPGGLGEEIMRDLIRQIVSGYKSLKLEGQDEGYVVFSGKDPDTRQAVSIKILPRLLGQDPQIARHFRGVAQTIRQLNHPNIASIRRVGEEAGLPYLITRTIEKGHSLAVKLDQPWAVDTAADVVMQVGQALEHAYNKGVVHGSLTPENVVVQDNGNVLVTDFGLGELAKLVGAPVKAGASPYLAPEVMAGAEADSRSDVYSMSALFYSMLTKRQPQVVKGEVLPPSRFNPDVPEKMDKVVVKGLAESPDDRYPDAKTFLAALGAVTLVPAKDKAQEITPGGRCPRCGADKQTGKFCRQCGLRLKKREQTSPRKLEKSKLDEPIQVTKVDVGRVKMGSGVDVRQTTIAQPMMVATGEMESEFPVPLEMPTIDMSEICPSMGGQPLIAMPDPPEMPAIDWAEIAPPMPEMPSIEESSDSAEGD